MHLHYFTHITILTLHICSPAYSDDSWPPSGTPEHKCIHISIKLQYYHTYTMHKNKQQLQTQNYKYNTADSSVVKHSQTCHCSRCMLIAVCTEIANGDPSIQKRSSPVEVHLQYYLKFKIRNEKISNISYVSCSVFGLHCVCECFIFV
jgi:hypothetical protein